MQVYASGGVQGKRTEHGIEHGEEEQIERRLGIKRARGQEMREER